SKTGERTAAGISGGVALLALLQTVMPVGDKFAAGVKTVTGATSGSGLLGPAVDVVAAAVRPDSGILWLVAALAAAYIWRSAGKAQRAIPVPVMNVTQHAP